MAVDTHTHTHTDTDTAAGAAAAFRALEKGFEVPDQGCLPVGLSIVAPAITVHGRPEQKEMFREGLYRGERFACQLFSEPEHGSDLAGTSTRAVRDGDEWIVNGQKAWSRAQASGPDDVPDRHGPAGGRGADADPDDRRACSLAGPAAVADTGAWAATAGGG